MPAPIAAMVATTALIAAAGIAAASVGGRTLRVGGYRQDAVRRRPGLVDVCSTAQKQAREARLIGIFRHYYLIN